MHAPVTLLSMLLFLRNLLQDMQWRYKITSSGYHLSLVHLIRYVSSNVRFHYFTKLRVLSERERRGPAASFVYHTSYWPSTLTPQNALC